MVAQLLLFQPPSDADTAHAWAEQVQVRIGMAIKDGLFTAESYSSGHAPGAFKGILGAWCPSDSISALRFWQGHPQHRNEEC